MCGLAAIFAFASDAEPVAEAELVAMRQAMTRRGPDGAGLWLSDDGRVGLAHRRLSIIDLSPAAAQPMAFTAPGEAEPRARITYNGEIYNFRALRMELEDQGHVFKTQSDTEVLLHLYHRYGAEMVHRLRGMFALALWDEARQGLLLARDPLGIKPLYYADGGGTLRVASQVKALLAGGGVDSAPSPAGNVGFFLWGSIPEPHTLYRHIHAVEAGSTLWVDGAGVKHLSRFHDIPSVLASGRASCDGDGDLGEALAASVRHHLVADVPVGVFLSAGLDSATIAAHASDVQGAGLDTLTLGFEEYRGRAEDEVPLAEEVAAAYGTRHRTEYVAGRDFRHHLDDLLAAMDQPTIDGVNVYFVARAAARAGLKVALSGLGGDELFAGYDTFRQVPALVGRLGRVPGLSLLGRGLRVVAAPVVAHLASPKAAGLLELGTTYGGAYLLRRGLFMPWELPGVLDGDMAREGWRELEPLVRLEGCVAGLERPRDKVMALEMSFYMRNQLLRDADWAGMAHSLEIRLPLVDAPLLAQVAAMKRGPVKSDMARTPAKALPRAVLDRRKTGFGVPLRQWLAGGTAGGGGERGLRGWARRVHAAQGGWAA
jgi:asparagine synthase (glutamine-hydrolysing)